MSEHPSTSGRTSTTRAVRHHLFLVLVLLALGGVAGWLYADSTVTTYTSTTRVLVNPSVGNPYAPTPSSVRQDEATSLQTEAAVARSTEVLAEVADAGWATSASGLQRGLQVAVPPNTQILEISYTATDPAVAQDVADAVAAAYLDNRAQRFEEVNAARIERVENRTVAVVNELHEATTAARRGDPADRLFQSELASALRNELVSLRAQRTALEKSESPPGTVIAPATAAAAAGQLMVVAAPAGGALLGLALGCLLAGLLERLTGAVRSARDVAATGLPLAAAVPAPGWRARLLHRGRSGAFDDTVRRLRATLLDLEPRPDVIAVAPAGSGRSDAPVAEAVAESFAKAGHSVVLVQTDGDPTTKGLEAEERGLAEALLYEGLDVMDLLRPSVEPLLSLLPHGGITAQSRELMTADRLRNALASLTDAGLLVVVQSPGIDSAEGEAIARAADLALVVVTVDRTRPREVAQAAAQVGAKGRALAALVVGRKDAASRARVPRRVEEDDVVDGDQPTRRPKQGSKQETKKQAKKQAKEGAASQPRR